jgi:hypothetical protein
VDTNLRTLLTFEGLKDIENDQILAIVGFTVSVQKYWDSQEDGICPVDRLFNEFIYGKILGSEAAAARRTRALK